jgi:CheY-like chemotaxis protein
MLRELVHEMLSLDGHTVETADGGEAALVAFSAAAQAGRPFDVVITDLGMPKMDGRQLARFLKEQAPTLPVIVMTGWGTLMKGEEDLGAPVDGLLSKPPSIPQLQAVLSRVLSRSKPA